MGTTPTLKLPYPEPTDTHNIAEHIRLLAEAINLNIAGAFPGMIIPFRGNVVPAGWDLCDGTKGTPDLRDRFVRGTGAGNALKALSGANTVTLTQTPGHTHTATGAAGAGGSHGHSGSLGANIADAATPHTHSYGNTAAGTMRQAAFVGAPTTAKAGGATHGIKSSSPTTTASGDHQHTFSANVADDARGGMASHGHGVPINAAGGGAAFPIMPLFYSLVYIRKG